MQCKIRAQVSRYRVFVGVILAFSLLGCASTGSDTFSKRFIKYQRIAIVCAPAPGHDPIYAKLILKEVQRRVPSRLGRYLQTADCLYDVPVDTSMSPPKIDLSEIDSEYDGIVCLIYSYAEGVVFLDMDMIDVESRESVWHHQLDAGDSSVHRRLVRHGFWTPIIIKHQFYDF